MRFSDLVASSLSSLRQRAFRTTLTVLGVMIGTTAVIVMVSLGVGMSQAFLGNLESNWSLRTVTVYSPPLDGAQEGIPDKLATSILEDSDVLVGEPLDGMAATQGPTDRIEFWGFKFVHPVVGRPA